MRDPEANHRETIMNPVLSIPPQILLQPMRQGKSHSINPQSDATQSAFADYAFGPLPSNSRQTTEGPKATEAFMKPAAASPPSASTAWIAQLQAGGAVKQG
jgi:hypothetical protein